MASGISGSPYEDDPAIEQDLIEPDEGATLPLRFLSLPS